MHILQHHALVPHQQQLQYVLLQQPQVLVLLLLLHRIRRTIRVWLVSRYTFLSYKRRLCGKILNKIFFIWQEIVQGDWVSPGGVCLHDAFYSCIILIIILVIILIIILLLFFIFYIMDGCLRNINQNHRKRMRKSLICGKESSHKDKVNSPEDDSCQSKCCCSDESYIYGQDLSLGTRQFPTKFKQILLNFSGN